MIRTVDYLRRNAIAMLALACSLLSLAGASYAAFSVPAGSVGTRQLRNGAVTSVKLANGSITPSKLSSGAIGGSVRHWAFVNTDGTVLGGSRGAKASAPSQAGQPYHVSWGDQFAHSCAVVASSPGTEGNGPIADRIGVHVNEPGSRHGSTVVWVWPSSESTFVDARFYLVVIC
jgi:hypothetical protein